MKNIKPLIIVTLLLTGITQSQAQFFQKLKNSPMTIGVGWNIVDDDGRAWQIVETSEWNLKAFPSSLKIEKYYQDGFSFVFKGSYNKLNPIATDVSSGNQTSTFMSLDLGAQYNFCQWYNINEKWFNFDTDVFDVYSAFGAGYTIRNTTQAGNVPTLNVGFGMNAFIYNGWGINLEATGKFGLVSPIFKTPTNYVHYNFGIIKKFSPKRKRIKDDVATSPIVLDETYNEEKNDTTPITQEPSNLKPTKMFAGQIIEEDEIPPNTQIVVVDKEGNVVESAGSDSEDQFKVIPNDKDFDEENGDLQVEVVDEIAFNQVELKDADFSYIDGIIKLLKKFPNAKLEIHGHADGKRNIEMAKTMFENRGLEYSKEAFDKMSKTYNQKLSIRRAQYAADYIIEKGIDKESISVIGHGESKPIAPNFLPDGSDNPEGRKLNRRVEFKIILKE